MPATVERLLRTLARHPRRARARGRPRRPARGVRAARAARRRVGERAAADRRRADDLQPLRRGPHARAAQAGRQRARARRRHGARATTPRCSRGSRHVWSIEIHAELSERAGATLARLGVENITLRVGDGAQGWPRPRPTTPSTLPPPRWAPFRPLLAQLASGGRLVAPVERGDQHLVHCRRTNGDVSTRLERVRFVPLT